MRKFFVIILFGYLPFIFAQDTLHLNLEDCINLAVQFNHDLKIAELEYQKAEEQVSETFGSSVFATLKGEVNYRRALKRGVIIIETPVFKGNKKSPQPRSNSKRIRQKGPQP